MVLIEALQWLADPANWSGPTGVWARLVEHVGLTAAAVGIACAVALPLALWLGHVDRGRVLVVNVANVGRAIPTYALLVLLAIGPLGLGAAATVTALVFFAIPPILTSAHTGVREVDPDVVEAARGMGMAGPAVLRRVELPLAAPLRPVGGPARDRAGRGHGHHRGAGGRRRARPDHHGGLRPAGPRAAHRRRAARGGAGAGRRGRLRPGRETAAIARLKVTTRPRRWWDRGAGHHGARPTRVAGPSATGHRRRSRDASPPYPPRRRRPRGRCPAARRVRLVGLGLAPTATPPRRAPSSSARPASPRSS